MKRFEIILIQIFAVIGSYLIVSMPFVFGFQVNVVTSDMQEFQTSMPDFTQLIEKSFSYPYRMNIQYIKITLSGKDPSKTIKKVYLYRCKDYDPVQCLQNGILPVISVSPFNATIWFNDETRWSDVQRNGIANFLTLVKMEIGGKEVWTGSWDITKQEGVGQFTEKNYDLDKLNVYLKPGVQGTTVKNYIESYLSVPTNWVDHSVLTLVEGSSVEKLYELTGNKDEVDPSGTGTPSFYMGVLTGNNFNGSSKEWTFIFGGDGKIANPVTFYNSGGAPPVVSGAKLKIDNWNPQNVTCGGSAIISVTSHIENVSALNCGESDCYFQDYYYTIDGVQSTPGSVTCSITNPADSIYKYTCSMPVNAFPVCSAPKTSIISLYFSYKNNVLLSAEFPVTLQKPPASLIVNSVIPTIFDCGIDTELTANLKITNTPAGTPNKLYTFDGVNFKTMSCTGSGGTFVCKILEDEICSLLQEDLNIRFKFEYPEVDLLSDPVNLHVTFPPPSMGVDTVTPEVVTAGVKTSAEVLVHVNYPDSISYSETDFKYKYLDKPFQSVTCSLANSFTNIKYHECSIELDIPSGKEGVEELQFRLDGYQGGQLKSLLANYFITIKSPPPQASLTIVSTSSPLDCIKDSSLTVQAKTENIQESPTSKKYSVDGGKTFETLTCSSSGSVYTCYIPKEDLCSLLTNSLELILKFSYGANDLVSNTQKIYVNLPEPHMQVYSVFPDALPIGKTSQAAVNLYIQYPQSVGSSPKFVYSYLDKSDQSMSCQKVSSTSIRDYYRCPSTTFTIPSDYAGNQISVIFAVEGTTLTYPYNIGVTSAEVGAEPWFEVYSTTPGKIEVESGNSTSATLSIMVHNAAENNLKHSATLQPTKWITSGTCQETNIDYDFSCDVKIQAPKDAQMGENKADVTIRVSDGKTYTLTNQTKVYVLPGEFYLSVQSLTPDKLYCQGHKQPNPTQVKVNAKLMNTQADSLLQEKIVFNGFEIAHTDRYCTFQAGSITCNIPVDKLLEKVACGQGDLAPGEGLHYYPLSVSVLLRKGDEQIQVSGLKDLGVEAIPLQAYLEIIDSDIEQGYLKDYINCLSSKTIKLGDGGDYIRIRYADLLHQTPDEGDLTWSFRLDANDEIGKLTKGMGVSPTANATICKMKSQQQVGVHRYEDYQCTLFVDRKMFQRCAFGEGTLTVTVTSKTMGRTAEGEVKVYISRGDEDFDLYVQVEKDASDEITCWVTSFDGRCHLEHSQLNSTLSIKNRASGDIGDLKLFDADIQLKGGDVETDVYSPYCRETAQGSRRYICGFGIRPAIKIEETVTNETNQTFRDVDLGDLEFTALVKYADNLAEDSLKADIGSITVKPKKDPAFIDYLEQKKKIQGAVKTVKDIVKIVLFIAGFCVTCAAGTYIYRGATENKTTTSPYEPGDYLPEIDGIKFADKPTCPGTCDAVCPPKKQLGWGGEYYCPNDPQNSANLACCVTCDQLQSCSDCVKAGCEWCADNIYGSKDICYVQALACKEGQVKKTTAECSAPSTPPTTAPATTIPGVSSTLVDAQKKLEKCRTWECAVPVLLIIVGLFVLFKVFIGDKLADQGEYTKALERGLEYGFICVVLQVLGGVLGEGKGEHALTKAGDFLYDACKFLAKAFPALIALLSIVMRFITFQMCIEDIERSLDQGYYGGTTAGAYQSGLVGTQSAVSRLQACMNQFSDISRDAWQIGQSMYYSGAGIWGQAKLTLKGSKTSNELTNGGTLCKDELINYKVENWCKVISEDGYDAQYMYTTSDGKECGKVTLYSAQSCSGYYGYGYGWGSGWGVGSYTPMYQAPGTSDWRSFSPVSMCGHSSTDKHEYILKTSRHQITIKYDLTC